MVLSRRSLLAFATAGIALFLFIATVSDRLHTWTDVDGYYDRWDPHRSHQAPVNASRVSPHPNHATICEGFPDTSNMLLVMKTGASEAFAKVPTQLITTLKCVPDFLLFSDLNQNIGGYRIHDSLENVLKEVKEGNPDFDVYRRQKKCLVDVEACNKLGEDTAKEGWKLDKYKFLHVADMAYKMRPGYDWYVFIEADTYISVPNLVQWLVKLNPRKKLYMGSVAMWGGFPFGHGGSGYVVSAAGMASLLKKNPGIAAAYDTVAKQESWGDYVFAKAMKEKAGIDVTQAWPSLNGEKPSTLPFGSRQWCHPIITMHHMNSQEIDEFWSFERSWNSVSRYRPLLIKDVYHQYLGPKLQSIREDWDNNSNDQHYFDPTSRSQDWSDKKDKVKDRDKYNAAEKVAHLSAGKCAAACKSAKECFQWKYYHGLCSFHKEFSMGKPVKRHPDSAKQVISGWDVEKILKWINDQGDCGRVDWPDIKTFRQRARGTMS
ncbi:glycosyltransferase family 31 protein [Immersiella caudata]|uniref:Glycosyltransferase family 31 protein n=1 Tax=Immersiella caudata TaxID=314043 RepID=A0AA39U3V1_9PEZI|nr:glycosyltransferase family 31 protein [Immersiella caudata]